MADEKKLNDKKSSWWFVLIVIIVLVIIVVIVIWWFNSATASIVNNDFINDETITNDTNSRKVNPKANVNNTSNERKITHCEDPKALLVKSCVKQYGLMEPVSPISPMTVVSSSLTPAQILSAYTNKSNVPDGKNIKYVIVVCCSTKGLQADLDLGCMRHGIRKKNIIIHELGSPHEMHTDDGWALEMRLDCLYSIPFLPNAEIHLVSAPSPSVGDLVNALQYTKTKIVADVVSMSWGIDESIVAQYNLQSLFQPVFATSTNRCYWFAASGDSFDLSFPSTHPGVVSVGGTTLVMKDLSRDGEYAWGEADGSGGGKGISDIYPRPNYQQATNSSSFRQVPDWCAVASSPGEQGVVVYYKGKAYRVSGTSLACPVSAAVVACGLSQRTQPRPPQAIFMTNVYATICPNKSFNSSLVGVGAIQNDFITFVRDM
jgi:subtilase family serine protease